MSMAQGCLSGFPSDGIPAGKSKHITDTRSNGDVFLNTVLNYVLLFLYSCHGSTLISPEKSSLYFQNI